MLWSTFRADSPVTSDRNFSAVFKRTSVTLHFPKSVYFPLLQAQKETIPLTNKVNVHWIVQYTRALNTAIGSKYVVC